MKKTVTLLIAVIIIFGIGHFVFGWSLALGTGTKSGAAYDAVKEISKYEYKKTYSNPAYGFSFKYPEGFDVEETPGDDNLVILAQNIPKKIGLQIIISPIQGSDADLSVEAVKENIPDMEISQAKEIAVGGSGARKGIMFTSNNEAFGGESSEIWFVAKGNLYQLSTYGELGDFLSGLFSTWKFI